MKIMKENEEGDEENERLLYLHKNIETKLAKFAVVPHAGTWIEILIMIPLRRNFISRSPRGNVD